MQEIQLSKIQGIHPEFARAERELDLAPSNLPDRALLPMALIQQINKAYPLVITDQGSHFCIGQTSLYRWLRAHLEPQTQVSCLFWQGELSNSQIRQFVLMERLVAPALAQISPLQVRNLFAAITPAKSLWPHTYRSHAHLAQLVGVKTLKGQRHKIENDAENDTEDDVK